MLVCGDAAGLLEPWTREGISFALRSGRLAGEWAVRIAESHDAVDARRQALNYAFAIKAGLGVEMGVGRRMLTLFERRPGMLHAVLTGFRPAWKAFAGITRGIDLAGRAGPYASAGTARPVGDGPLDGPGEGSATGGPSRGRSCRGGPGRPGPGPGPDAGTPGRQASIVTRKTGWSGAMRRSSSSDESGPTPPKKTPTSAFQRLR